MTTTLRMNRHTAELVSVAWRVLVGDEILTDGRHGAEWTRVRGIATRDGVRRILLADGTVLRRNGSAHVFIRRSVTA